MSDIAVKSAIKAAHTENLSEDWLSAAIGVLVFALALFSLSGTDLLGWAVTTSVYTNIGTALAPVSKTYAALGGVTALLLTYVSLLVVLSAGVAALGADVRKFALRFTVVFAIAYASWIAGSYAYVAAVTPAEQQKFGIAWSLKLTNEGGFIVALLSGLVIANFFPRFAEWLKEAIRPELYIKIAIVILGATIAVTAAGRLNLASSLLLRGVAAIVEAYLIYCRWSISSRANGSASAANGRCRSPPASRSAAWPLRSQRAARSAPGLRFRSWCRRWSWCSRWSKC